MASPARGDADTTRRSPHRRRHTVTQRLVLGVAIFVAFICFAAAGVLLWGKHERELFQAVESLPATTSVAAASTTSTSPSISTPVTTDPDAEPSTTVAIEEEFPPPNPDAKNYLIAAADNHACVDPNSPWANAADPDRPASDRSDSIMIIRVDPVTRAAAVLSFPRDLWIRTPSGGQNRINAMYRQNDPSRLVATIQQNFGVPVDHYVQVDFCAFKTIVDAVGGVAVPFSNPIRDPHVNLDIPNPGCHEFSGDEALAYVRSRHLQQYVNGKWSEDRFSDFARISRQQDFLTRTMRSAHSKGTFNPSVARGLLRTFQNGDLITDQGFSINEILGLAGLLRDIDPETLLRYQVEGKGQMIQGNAVVVPTVKNAHAQAVFDIFRGLAPLNAPVLPDDTADSGPDAGAPTDSAAPGTDAPGTTVASAPEEVIKGDIMPDPTVTCG